MADVRILEVSTDHQRPRLGVVGAGKIGTAIARAGAAGRIRRCHFRSGAVERIELIVELLAPGAPTPSPPTTSSAMETWLFWRCRCTASTRFPRDLFAGKILVDAMNYWQENRWH